MNPDANFRYTVSCRFVAQSATVAQDWLDWLLPGHLQDVLAAGALSAEVLRIDDEFPHFEIRYVFASREAFRAYEEHHAPRLRAEGLARFPPSLGMEFRRTTGEVLGRGSQAGTD